MATLGDENDPTTEDDAMSPPAVAACPDPELDGMMLLPMPPQDGFTAEDLDRIPNLPRHTELIDGNLVFVSPQKFFHMFAVTLLNRQMDAQAPADFIVCREMTAVLGKRQRPEPDLMLVRSSALRNPDDTWFAAEDVSLVVEVVSPESEIRDRVRKPRLYAEAGIAHFWLVEQEERRGATVHVYELDPLTNQYALVGSYRDRLKVGGPCNFDIDLTQWPWPDRG
ncbi:Uma2 family endonuclease [Nocardiopsis terrae]